MDGQQPAARPAVSYFEVLGVPPTASDDEIAAAYHCLARQVHPDAHPGASAAQRASYEAEMTRINVAYEAVKTAARRRVYQPRPPTTPHRSERPESRARCNLCGATAAEPFKPAARAPSTIRLCRRCALCMTSRPVDTHALSRYLRIGLALAALAVAAAVLVLRTAAIPSTNVNETRDMFNLPLPTRTTPVNVPTTAVDPWLVHDCVTARPQRDPVDCTEPHAGQIIARVPRLQSCPPGTDSYAYVKSINGIACIDEQ